MHLDLSQEDVFFETMDSLLAYTNDRFDVVEGYTMDFDDPLVDQKAEIVSHVLWENTALIEDFVRDNPYHLPARCLDAADAWRSALRGVFQLVRYQGGNALLMDDDAVYSVCGVTSDMDEVVGAAPAVVECVLLPFEGMVVYDGFIVVGSMAPREERRLADRFDELAARGIIASAEQFAAFQQKRAEAAMDAQLDELLAGLERDSARASGEEQLPAGFHRGLLAGLSPEDRMAAVVEEARKIALAQGAAFEYPPAPVELSPAEEQAERAVLCASACVTYCGLTRLEDAFASYQQVFGGTLDEQAFLEALANEASYGDMDFVVWRNEGTTYLLHYTLSREYVMSQAARWKREGTLRGELSDELAGLETMRAYLIDEHRRMNMRPLPYCTYDEDAVMQLFAGKPVQALRAFLDERIPDGEDDYAFADQAAQEIMLSAIEVGDLQALYSFADEIGLDGCCEDPSRLRTLIANVYENMPSWESNGWSPREVQEQLTGKRVFYDEDGRRMRVGPNDPCPCGSGKTYRECCGR